MQAQTKQNMTPARGQCIGCADCTGMCHALMDLAFLPETVLKGAPAAR